MLDFNVRDYVKLMKFSKKNYQFMLENLKGNLVDMLNDYYQWGYTDEGDGNTEDNYSDEDLDNAIREAEMVIMSFHNDYNKDVINKLNRYFTKTYQDCRSDKGADEAGKAEDIVSEIKTTPID